MSALWNVGLCGRGHDGPQLMRMSLGGHELASEPHTLLDELVPAYDVASRHTIWVAADPARVYQAARHADLSRPWLLRLLMGLRTGPAWLATRFRGHRGPRTAPIIGPRSDRSLHGARRSAGPGIGPRDHGSLLRPHGWTGDGKCGSVAGAASRGPGARLLELRTLSLAGLALHSRRRRAYGVGIGHQAPLQAILATHPTGERSHPGQPLAPHTAAGGAACRLTRACSRRAGGARLRSATARRERAVERRFVRGPARWPAADAQVVRRQPSPPLT